MARWIRTLFGRPLRRTRSNARRSNRFNARPQLWYLEDKVVPTTFTVTTVTADTDGYSATPGGTGNCLREAIVAANADASPGPHIIDCTGVTGSMDISPFGLITITNSMNITGSAK